MESNVDQYKLNRDSYQAFMYHIGYYWLYMGLESENIANVQVKLDRQYPGIKYTSDPVTTDPNYWGTLYGPQEQLAWLILNI